MRFLRFASLGSLALAGAVTVFACKDDETAVIRERIDAGALDGAASGDGSTCNVTLPTTYDSPAFEVNAADELGLRTRFEAFLKPMLDLEAAAAVDGGAADAGVSASTLAALYADGNPSVRSLTTIYYQGKIDAYVAEYEAASTATYVPNDPPPSTGGRIADSSHQVSVDDARGVDLRQAMQKGLYNAAFFNHATLLVGPGQPVSVTTVDRLVAAFGANPSFPNSPAAPTNPDVYAAALAASRDSNDPATPGPYQRAKAALIKARATSAVTGCDAERDAALATFFLEWEKSQLATVVYDFVHESTMLDAPSKDSAAILRLHGEALGLIAGFRTVDATRRKITDAQIDDLLQKAFATNGAPPEVYKVVTSQNAKDSLAAANAAIKNIYGFTDAEMKDFETFYP